MASRYDGIIRLDRRDIKRYPTGPLSSGNRLLNVSQHGPDGGHHAISIIGSIAVMDGALSWTGSY